jgi:hypothetical protein
MAKAPKMTGISDVWAAQKEANPEGFRQLKVAVIKAVNGRYSD